MQQDKHMHITIGLLAHVDAGKTTLSEQLLYRGGAIRNAGRVDHQDALLDSDPLERRRGITIFSGQSSFCIGNFCFELLDTPGHVDFSGEMERCLPALDMAIVVISAVEGVQGHTETILHLLEQYQIPALCFLNKTDRAGADVPGVLARLSQLLPGTVMLWPEHLEESHREMLAEGSEKLMEAYFDGNTDEDFWLEGARELLRQRQLFPCFCGCALNGQGVDELLQGLTTLAHTAYDSTAPLSLRVYQVRRDGPFRVSFVKVLGGTLHAKDTIGGEKINEVRRYSGAKFTPLQEAAAGMLCGVTGLTVPPGTVLGADIPPQHTTSQPALMARVLFDPSLHPLTVLDKLRILEEEEPLLHVDWQEDTQQIRVHIMGTIQLEVLQELMDQRFGLAISFGPCQVLYQETLAAPVEGWGHFEPLRHYAEVHLRLEPAPRGEGITFHSECSTDRLALNWQRLIGTHVLECAHPGALTGAPLTDVRVVLLGGCAHEKHTEGGDFREATYRAIRQGLFSGESLLLEPWYAFSISVEASLAGRVMADVQRMGGSFEPPFFQGERQIIQGCAPASEMMSYAQELCDFSRGRGVLSLRLDGYAPCHNAAQVIEESGYDRERDAAHPAGSVFCSHGSGYLVPWQEAPAHMHTR